MLSFIFGLAVSWERWGNPLVDCGREMNQALRLARGEMLYSDVRHIYGPLSPYINALLYTIFEPSLTVLYANGVVTAIIILSLVYWLSRQMMDRLSSVAATLSVLWICALKPAGNYVLPYSYSALHGCALGLISLALIALAVGRAHAARACAADPGGPKTWLSSTEARLLALAGVTSGLTILAKTEMGLAAMITGVVAAALASYPDPKRMVKLALAFLIPCATLALAVYGHISSRVGWSVLSEDSFLFLQNLPPELVYFNKRVSGFDQPLQSFYQMIGSALRVLSLALTITAISLLLAYKKNGEVEEEMKTSSFISSNAGKASYLQLWMLLLFSVALFFAAPLLIHMQWDTGPYVAMPLLLLALLVTALIRYQREQIQSGYASKEAMLLIVIAVYALASLARVMLRVRSGGAYSSYLIPASVILFIYFWGHSLSDLMSNSRARRAARGLALSLILAWTIVTAGVLAFRYRTNNVYELNTMRGNMVTLPDLGKAFDEAISYIERETAPGDHVAVIPEGTSLNFFTDRPNPLREEIVTPGFLDTEGEEQAIRMLSESQSRLILVTNRPTSEFGANVFGQDYSERLMQWIEENYEQCAIFGPNKSPGLRIGDKTFFIRAYCKRAGN